MLVKCLIDVDNYRVFLFNCLVLVCMRVELYCAMLFKLLFYIFQNWLLMELMP